MISSAIKSPTLESPAERNSRRDISTASIESLSWAANDIADSLNAVHEFAVKQAQDAITWYYAKKRPKALASRALRLLAIGFATIGGLIPIVVNLSYIPQTWMLERWGFVLLGLAAACLALDKFFGFSTGWVRYITTAQSLQNELYTFQMDWAKATSKLASNVPTMGQIDEFLQLAKTLGIRVMQEVTQETQQWVIEFQSNLADLEKTTKTQLESARPGALTVAVDNATLSEPPVAVDIDGIAYGTMEGNTWAIRQLAPGTHSVVVRGRKVGKRLQEAGTVLVPPGGAATLKLSFAIPDEQVSTKAAGT